MDFTLMNPNFSYLKFTFNVEWDKFNSVYSFNKVVYNRIGNQGYCKNHVHFKVIF